MGVTLSDVALPPTAPQPSVIGTNDGGLNLYNPIKQRFTSYTLQEDESARGIGSNNIKAVYVDEKKSLVYIGTHAGGLSILHRNSGQVENFNQRNSQLVNENVYIAK